MLVVLCSSVARGGDLEDGYKAYEKKDYATALELWQPLAEEGVAKAKHYLGFMYQNGYGVEQDAREAVKWYRKAARQGYGKAQYNLGVMYEKGQGVLQDYEEAVKWYRKAARKGVAGAQTNLGLMYDLGHGVKQDYVRAHMWNNLAAINGNDNGSNNRDSLAKEMTPTQISEAEDMARDCLKKNYKDCD